MRYKVNTRCPQCGRAYSYWSDDKPKMKRCPNTRVLNVDGVAHIVHPCSNMQPLPDVRADG